jgi:hypothetical protein
MFFCCVDDIYVAIPILQNPQIPKIYDKDKVENNY